MNFLKIASKAMIFFSLILNPLTVMVEPIPITDIDVVAEKVRTLRRAGVPAEEIGIVLDFHGVITKENQHQAKMTLKGNIRNFLEYLSEEKISFVVATAWNKFDQIEKGVEELGLSALLEVDLKNKTEEIFFTLGRELEPNIKGFINGKVTALKYTEKSKDPWYRQKAFSLEAKFGTQQFKHILFVDDNLGNHAQFEVDFKETSVSKSEPEVLQYYLRDARKAADKKEPQVIERSVSEDDFDILRFASALHIPGEGDYRGIKGRGDLKRSPDAEDLKRSGSLENSSDNLEDSR